MCLLLFLGFLIQAIFIVFVETARMLLPWTIGSAIVSGVIVVGMSSWIKRRFVGPNPQLPVFGFASFVGTFLIGYLSFWLYPPTPEPPPPPVERNFLEQLTTFPEPSEIHINRDDLFAMLPVHLPIAATILAFIVEGHVSRRSESSVPAEDGSGS